MGIAGVDGNGQSQLALVITGVLTPDNGTVDMKDSRAAQFTPNGFILENVSRIPEDRNKMGLIGKMSVKDNIVLKTTETEAFFGARGLVLKKKPIRDYALEMQKKYDIRCTSVGLEARNLSGGNQQEVILAREPEGSPDLLVALISVLLVFVIGCIIMAALGTNLFVALQALWTGAFGSMRNLGTTLPGPRL